jgi:lipopolysaccharide export system ATP-binding protein
VEQLLQEFQLSSLSLRKGQLLSGGERRRVEIARSLAGDPKFILLDEPFAGVDPISIDDIHVVINLLKKRGVGVLITDHNVRETFKVCNRSYIVNNGMICTEGTPKEIMDNEFAKKIYLGDKFLL